MQRAVLWRAASSGAEAPTRAPSIVHDVLRTAGRPLDPATRAELEPRFGRDLSGIRVHDDARAAESVRAVRALAYTVGEHIAFAEGRHRPESEDGRRLLAHEVTHVIQQGHRPDTSTPLAVVDSAAAEREAETASRRVASGSPARASYRTGRALHRFGSMEHKSLGDTATGTATVNVGGDTAATRFELTYGDVVMLSGDYFEPDELMRLGAIPGRSGQAAGTRDEIVCAIHHINASDPRFAPGGRWHGYTFPDAVREAVESRYNRLAASNTSHFVAPRGRTAAGVPNPPVGGEGSAGTNYRALHERAITTAYAAGGSGGSIDRALGMEAAAQHFLTDAFASGHLRTPIGLIRDYWGAKYPLFWYNLLHKIALDTAVEMNARVSNLTTILGSVQQMYEGIMTQMNAIAATLPPVTLGDLIAKVFHDYDNEAGLDIAGGGRLYGDSHLDESDPNNVTRSRAQAAVQAGVREVREAFTLGGGQGAQLAGAALFAAVRSAVGAPAGQFLPETHIPRPDPSAPAQNWRAADFETLWTQHMTGSSGPTVGARIRAAVAPGGEIHHQLRDLANRFPAVEPRASGNLQPRRSYLDGFFAPLVADPQRAILGIIHWAPSYGLSGEDRDDVSLDTGQELDRGGRLGGMTTRARARYVRELIGGSVAGDEEALVVRIFETAPAAERARIYALVEGHPWTGDWIQGWTVTDDDIWDALNTTRLATVRRLINAGWSRPSSPAPAPGASPPSPPPPTRP